LIFIGSGNNKDCYWELKGPIKYDGSRCLWFHPLLMSVSLAARI